MVVMNTPGNRISVWIRASLIFATSTALALHIIIAFSDIILPQILYLFALLNSSLTPEIKIAPEKKPAPSRQMILINPDLKDEKVKDASLLADASRQATQPLPQLDLKKGDATIKGARRSFVRPGSRPSPSVPTPRPQPRQRRPEKRTQPAQNQKQVNPSTKGDLAPKPPEPPRPKQTRRKTPPPVKVIKPSSPSTPALVRKNQITTSLVKGNPSMAMLKKRWPEYFRKLVTKVEKSLYRQTIISHSSFKTGIVSFLCAINKDGTLTIRQTRSKLKGMRSETEMFRRTLNDAAPFDPLTEDMQKDPLFENLGFSLYIR